MPLQKTFPDSGVLMINMILISPDNPNITGLEFTAFPGKVKIVAERQKLEGGFPPERYHF